MYFGGAGSRASERKSSWVQVSKALTRVGLLAVELFLTENGEVLVNELARPHNGGHHTIETTLTDQFEQHIRAVLGYP